MNQEKIFPNHQPTNWQEKKAYKNILEHKEVNKIYDQRLQDLVTTNEKKNRTSQKICYKIGEIVMHQEQSSKNHLNPNRDYFAVSEIRSLKCSNCSYTHEQRIICAKKHTTSVKTVNLTSGLIQNLPTNSLVLYKRPIFCQFVHHVPLSKTFSSFT